MGSEPLSERGRAMADFLKVNSSKCHQIKRTNSMLESGPQRVEESISKTIRRMENSSFERW